MVRRVTVALMSLALMAGGTTLVAAQESEPDRPLPEHLADLKLDEPSTATHTEVAAKLDPELLDADGTQLVSIELSEDPVATAAAGGAGGAEQEAQQARVEQQ
ncbi:hypothetical protein, partial [Phytoactinopolyspora endophytica]|uniref:hypothetical protein n=1 Tax=Phytoactinopolyspora endophytica TaxID=1642495 RepID=UPI0013ED7C1C